MSTMENVLFITDLHIGAHVRELDGVYERAVRHGWHVIEVEHEKTTRALKDYIQYWNAAGCIMECAALTKPLEPARAVE